MIVLIYFYQIIDTPNILNRKMFCVNAASLEEKTGAIASKVYRTMRSSARCHDHKLIGFKS